VIDGALFQHEVEARQVMAVPSLFLNGELLANGRMDVEEIIAKIDSGAAARSTAKLHDKAPYDVLVVGGGPAGAAAAIYAARKGIRTGLVAERVGGQVLDTLDIENLISVPHTEGPKLASALQEHVRQYDVDVIPLQRGASLRGAATPNELIELQLASGITLKAKTVVLATGARWREMRIPGEGEYKTRGVAFCPHCDGPLFKGKKVAVIGGGNSGIEAAIDLAGIVEHVTVFEFMPELKADAVLQNKLRSLSNARVLTNVQPVEVLGDGKRATALRYKDRVTEVLHEEELACVFVQIGLLPNTDWLKGTLDLNKMGEIVVDAHGRTSLPGVFAAGDCTTVPYKQIVIAMGEGAKAALSAFDYLIRGGQAT
ncbi:MAG: alkyl hydroperoxide reductase subunit F, partial [Brachymonas sp.]|nr:alkyl hydroperoxide reductase subunit F [Brachymonas sp.]